MNQLIVFSDTTHRWIYPQSNWWYYYPKIRKRQGEEAIIHAGTRKRGKVILRRVHVMVEKSSNGYWLLVEKK